MEIKLEDITGEDIIQKLEDNQKQIEELKNINKSLISEQVELFSAFVNKLMPVLNFLRDNRYNFSHPILKPASLRGPVIGYNKIDNLLFVFDVRENCIRQVNLFNKEEFIVTFYHFFENNNFEIAMDGLLSVLKKQNETINTYRENNEKRASGIKAYRI